MSTPTFVLAARTGELMPLFRLDLVRPRGFE